MKPDDGPASIRHQSFESLEFCTCPTSYPVSDSSRIPRFIRSDMPVCSKDFSNVHSGVNLEAVNSPNDAEREVAQGPKLSQRPSGNRDLELQLPSNTSSTSIDSLRNQRGARSTRAARAVGGMALISEQLVAQDPNGPDQIAPSSRDKLGIQPPTDSVSLVGVSQLSPKEVVKELAPATGSPLHAVVRVSEATHMPLVIDVVPPWIFDFETDAVQIESDSESRSKRSNELEDVGPPSPDRITELDGQDMRLVCDVVPMHLFDFDTDAVQIDTDSGDLSLDLDFVPTVSFEALGIQDNDGGIPSPMQRGNPLPRWVPL